MATQRVHHPDRLTHPLLREGERGEGRWRKVSWDEAYDYLATKLHGIATRYGWRSTSWLSLTGNVAVKAMTVSDRIANCLGGTRFSKAGLSSDSAGYMGYFPILGEYCKSNDLSEVTGARYYISVGKNWADTGHSDMHFLFDAMELGCKFVMVDPRFSRTAAKADEWIAPRPATDTALAMAMINVIVTGGLMKEDYVVRYTNGPHLVRKDTHQCIRERDLREGGSGAYVVWDEGMDAVVASGHSERPTLRGSRILRLVDGKEVDCHTAFDACWSELAGYTPEMAASVCGVPAEQIRKTAIEYATADPAWIMLGLGPQRYSQGHTMVRAWVTLASFCGNIGKPYAGVSLLDGPTALFGLAPPEAWVMPGGKKGHSLTGTKIVEIIASEAPYPIKSLWAQSYNLASQSPLFKRFVTEALPKLELFAVSEQVMTDAARYADIVLPCTSFYEDDWDLVGNQENWYIQLRRRAIPPVGESRNDFDIYRGLCEKLGIAAADWQLDPEQACRDILLSHSDQRISSVDWETLKRDGIVRVEVERPYTPFRDMKFNTPSGKIEIYQEQFADIGEHVLSFREPAEGHRSPRAKLYPLTLITYKHVHSTHSQHTILPYIREVLPEPRLEISPQDAGARSIADGESVMVFNDRGQFVVKAMITNAARPGTLSLPEGWWNRDFVTGHPGDLGFVPVSAAQDRIMETNWAAYDLLCDVRRLTKAAP